MCNPYRVSTKQIELAKRYGFDVDKLMPEPDSLPPPELFPKKPGGSSASMTGSSRWT